jgi:hypothetical protein
MAIDQHEMRYRLFNRNVVMPDARHDTHQVGQDRPELGALKIGQSCLRRRSCWSRHDEGRHDHWPHDLDRPA